MMKLYDKTVNWYTLWTAYILLKQRDNFKRLLLELDIHVCAMIIKIINKYVMD
jgi:hypothetical protein